eukprot:3416141-Prymnesium_polylepis.2
MMGPVDEPKIAGRLRSVLHTVHVPRHGVLAITDEECRPLRVDRLDEGPGAARVREHRDVELHQVGIGLV